jgi:CheY-like chemotaxis protein
MPDGFKALVVEDDQALGRLFVEMLVVAGFETKLIQNGLEALEYLKANQPDLILADLHLPEVSGLDIMAHVKTLPHLAQARTVVVTADLPRADEARPFADTVLIKPVDYHQFMNTIKSLMDSPSD